MSLTEREIEILDSLVEHDSVKSAANALKISPSTIYNMLYRLRKKSQRWRRNINILLGYRRKSKLLNKILARKVNIEEEKLLEG